MDKYVMLFEDFVLETFDLTSFSETKMGSKELIKFKPKKVDAADWYDAVQSVTDGFKKTASPYDVAEFLSKK